MYIANIIKRNLKLIKRQMTLDSVPRKIVKFKSFNSEFSK